MIRNSHTAANKPLAKGAGRTDDSQLYQYLAGIVPGITEASWRMIQGVFEPQHYKRNEEILEPGRVCEYAWFIKRGVIEKYQVIEGREHVNDLIDENNFFSDFNSFLFQIPANLGIRSLETTETLRVRYADVQRVYKDAPEADRVGRLIAEKLVVSQAQRIDELSLLSPENRYRAFLNSHPDLLLRIPQYLIASYLSMTPESLSRIRSRLKNNR